MVMKSQNIYYLPYVSTSSSGPELLAPYARCIHLESRGVLSSAFPQLIFSSLLLSLDLPLQKPWHTNSFQQVPGTVSGMW